ncbi:unnamed protein product [Pieris brassicae]|uniref:Uncharacterized protein n=1 Tax=Pieris brassicae TaxID=7116 RepID=A0A9P0X7W6_PIEBR|nr:unnamed protein product [Pieris brassicae]
MPTHREGLFHLCAPFRRPRSVVRRLVEIKFSIKKLISPCLINVIEAAAFENVDARHSAESERTGETAHRGSSVGLVHQNCILSGNLKYLPAVYV